MLPALLQIDTLQAALHEHAYIADRGLAIAAFLALKMQRPLLLEGEPGVGKTEVAKALADLFETDLIRLQCYEGLDVHQAVYEWNYSRQIMHLRYLESQQQAFAFAGGGQKTGWWPWPQWSTLGARPHAASAPRRPRPATVRWPGRSASCPTGTC